MRTLRVLRGEECDTRGVPDEVVDNLPLLPVPERHVARLLHFHHLELSSRASDRGFEGTLRIQYDVALRLGSQNAGRHLHDHVHPLSLRPKILHLKLPPRYERIEIPARIPVPCPVGLNRLVAGILWGRLLLLFPRAGLAVVPGGASRSWLFSVGVRHGEWQLCTNVATQLIPAGFQGRVEGGAALSQSQNPNFQSFPASVHRVHSHARAGDHGARLQRPIGR